MHEDVRATIDWRYEAEALVLIEKLYCAVSHVLLRWFRFFQSEVIDRRGTAGK